MAAASEGGTPENPLSEGGKRQLQRSLTDPGTAGVTGLTDGLADMQIAPGDLMEQDAGVPLPELNRAARLQQRRLRRKTSNSQTREQGMT